MSLSLHFPEARHVLVIFPLELVYPVGQENVQLDPYVLGQGAICFTAWSGVTSGVQVTTLNRKWIKSNHLPYLISQRRLLPVPLLLRNIVEIERLLLRAAILVSNVLRGWA